MLVLASSHLAAADWIEYRSGPFHVFSDAGDRAGRERLNELEQLRFVLGNFIGKSDLTTIWPMDVVLFSNQKEYTPHVLPQPLTDGGSATLAAWAADIGGKGANKEVFLPRDLVRAITARLIEDNAGRMPGQVETALEDLLSTIEAVGTKVNIGAPLLMGELTGDRLRAWAKLQMLATLPEFSGKFRVYLNNLQQAGDEDAAAHNAFDSTAAKIDDRAKAYLQAGKFEAAPVTGRALNPNRDFIEKNVDRAAVEALIKELDARGKDFPPESPRGLLAKNTLPSLELAAKANPKWAEPYFKMAALESNPAMRIARLKTAASLDPRNVTYWETLATSQAAAGLYADAESSWTSGERAARSPEERTRLHRAKLDLEDQRAAADIAARQRERDEEARDLQRVKDAAAAEIHAAERAANRDLAAHAGKTEGAVPWFGDPTSGARVAGSLTRVECMAGGSMRLTIQADPGQLQAGRAMKLMIRDPKKITVASDSGEAQFPCGVLKPARKIEVRHNEQPDAKLGTAGEITVVKFP